MISKAAFRRIAYKYYPVLIKLFKLSKAYQKMLSLTLENKGEVYGRTGFTRKKGSKDTLTSIRIVIYRNFHHTEYEVYSTLVHEFTHIVLWKHHLPLTIEEPLVQSMERAMRKVHLGFKTKK